jgi:hypothetical protein
VANDWLSPTNVKDITAIIDARKRRVARHKKAQQAGAAAGGAAAGGAAAKAFIEKIADARIHNALRCGGPLNR